MTAREEMLALALAFADESTETEAERANEAEDEIAEIGELVGWTADSGLELIETIEYAMKPPGPGSEHGIKTTGFVLQILAESEGISEWDRQCLDRARAIVWRHYAERWGEAW